MMADFALLPKDMRILVCKKLDMDGRIKLGLVRKLVVDVGLCEKLGKVFASIQRSVGTQDTMYFADIGNKYWSCFSCFKGVKQWRVYELMAPQLFCLCEKTNKWQPSV